MLAEEIQTTFGIDKSSWIKVKLGDVVREVRETVKDPVAEGIERIIGLEHLEPESLHIRTWGMLTDGTTFTKVFRKGQVLFGRRRAYLKKAALATFDGICSGDITVLEAKKGLLPELLPFLIQNDKFFELAVKNSAGSLSPRAKFADFADYEFQLPPIDQQEQIAELLWSGDEAANEGIRTYNICNNYYISYRELLYLHMDGNAPLVFNSLLKENVNSSIKFTKLGSVLTDIRYGTSKKGNTQGIGYEVIGIPQVINGKLSLDSISHVSLDEKEYQSCRLNFGDIVIVRTNGNPEYTGRSALYDIDNGHAFASYLIKISVNSELYNPEFILRYLQSVTIRKYFKRNATSSAGNYNINTETIKSVPIPVVPIIKQNEIVQQLKKVEQTQNDIAAYNFNALKLQKSLINQIF